MISTHDILLILVGALVMHYGVTLDKLRKLEQQVPADSDESATQAHKRIDDLAHDLEVHRNNTANSMETNWDEAVTAEAELNDKIEAIDLKLNTLAEASTNSVQALTESIAAVTNTMAEMQGNQR